MFAYLLLIVFVGGKMCLGEVGLYREEKERGVFEFSSFGFGGICVRFVFDEFEPWMWFDLNGGNIRSV